MKDLPTLSLGSPVTEENLALWNRHKHPHKDALKNFTRGGGFRGTAIDPMWMIREATEEWGPVGSRWGFAVVDEKYVTGAPMEGGGNEIIHVLLISLRHPSSDGGFSTVQSYGQTQFVGRNKNGYYTDEEAPKKSLTDAVSKALSWLGFGSEVHMGMFDGNKYVDLKGEPEPPPKPPEKPAAKPKPDPIERMKKYLGLMEGLIGGEATLAAWKGVLEESKHSCGATNLEEVKRKCSVPQKWTLSDELKAKFIGDDKPTDHIEEINKILGMMEELIGPEKTMEAWISLLKHSDHSAGALSVNDVGERCTSIQKDAILADLEETFAANKRIAEKADQPAEEEPF